jgi:hypothetical protein
MGHLFGSLVLVAAALFSLATTWSSASAPRQFAERLGFAIANASGYNEVRAQYAGFFLAIAMVCGAALLGTLNRQTAFIVLATVFGGLIAGRLFSLGMDRRITAYSPTVQALYAIDAVGFALAVTAIAVR